MVTSSKSADTNESGESVLIVEDDQATAELLAFVLGNHGFKSVIRFGVKDSVRFLRENRTIAAALVDLSLPDGDGIDVIREARQEFPELPCFVITASETTTDVVLAMKAGAVDYLVKPFEPKLLVENLSSAIAVYRAGATRRIQQAPYGPGSTRWRSPQMRAAVKEALEAAAADSPILITGPINSGRKSMAHLIHQNGQRREKPMISVNAAALQPQQLELELFGRPLSEPPNSVTAGRGKLERARGSDLFIEDIERLSLAMQAELADWLSKEPTSISASSRRCRLIASTSADLEAEVGAGRFLSELWYALSVYHVNLPGLADRPEDIPLICESIITHLCIRNKIPRPTITGKAMEMIMDHTWPGNLSELQSVLEHAVTKSRDRLIGPADLPRLQNPENWSGYQESRSPVVVTSSIDEVTKAAFISALEACGGNRRRTAKRLKVSLRTVYNMIQRYNIPAARKGRKPGGSKPSM